MERGGAELRTLDVASNLYDDKYQFDFVVLSGKEGALDAEIHAKGWKVVPCRLNYLFPFRFSRLIMLREYSVVHSHVHYSSGVMILLAALLGVPKRIAHFRSTGDGKNGSFKRSISNSVKKWLINRLATDIVAVSHGTMATAWSSSWHRDPRCRVIYNGIPAAPSFNENDRKEIRSRRLPAVPEGATLVLHVGRVIPEKNHVRAVKIFDAFLKHRENSHLVLVGKDTEKLLGSNRFLANDSKVLTRVHCLGECSDVRELMAAADLLILPSSREGLPGVVLEAASVGTPVLASDLPGCREQAEQLPCVDVIPLTSSNEEWADKLASLLLKWSPPAARRKARTDFEFSAFEIRRVVENFKALWTATV
jgi:glycosyltransferase involved in cell wall biosynthesis